MVERIHVSGRLGNRAQVGRRDKQELCPGTGGRVSVKFLSVSLGFSVHHES